MEVLLHSLTVVLLEFELDGDVAGNDERGRVHWQQVGVVLVDPLLGDNVGLLLVGRRRAAGNGVGSTEDLGEVSGVAEEGRVEPHGAVHGDLGGLEANVHRHALRIRLDGAV